MNFCPLFCLLLVAVLVFSAGCTSPSPSDILAPAPSTLIPDTPAPQIPATTPPSPLPTTLADTMVTTMATVTPVQTATWIPKTYDVTGNPRIILLEFRKEYFKSNLPDCGMRAAFPGAAADPGYGISRPNHNLTAYSEAQILDFLKANAKPNAVDIIVEPNISRAIEPDVLGGARCAGAVASPTWNFVLINATIMGRNARPAEYAIGFDVRSKGNVVAEIRADRNLTLDQPAIFTLYV
ncbi:MAG TPA: hypothetical protein VHN82_08405, partial [Methanoregula sp.]|nr:hypothetical protein [Methanoregula sp.]